MDLPLSSENEESGVSSKGLFQQRHAKLPILPPGSVAIRRLSILQKATLRPVKNWVHSVLSGLGVWQA